MLELSKERIHQILHEETMKSEETATILRSIYTRYMLLFEKYLADIDALNDDRIAEFRAYHEETQSLLRYYYMDIPHDTCMGLREFDKQYTVHLLGSKWREVISDNYEEFREKSGNEDKSEKELKAEFAKQTLEEFYDTMDLIFREGFGTGSQTVDSVVKGIKGLLFGKEK